MRRFALIFFACLNLQVFGETLSERKVSSLLTSAVRLRQDARYDEAFAILDFCKEISPDNAAVHYELAQVFSATSQNEKAFLELEKASQLAPENDFFLEQLMTFHEAYKRFDKAIEICKTLISRKPADESLPYFLISFYEQNGNYKEALSQLDKMEKSSGVDFNISAEKMKIFEILNQPKNIENEAKKLAKTFPTQVKYQSLLGEIYLSQGKRKKATAIFENILKNAPNDETANLAVLEFHLSQNDTTAYNRQLFAIFENRAIDFNVKLALLERLVTGYVKNNQFPILTEKAFAFLLENYPSEEALELYYIDFLLYKKQLSQATERIYAVLEKNPKIETLWIKLSQIVETDLKKSYEIASLALAHFPENSYFHYICAVFLQNNGEKEKAIEAISSAIKFTDEKNFEALSNFWGLKGDLLFATKRAAEAFSAYENSLSFNPKNIMVLNNYAYFLACENRDLKKAEKMSGTAVQNSPSNATFLDTYAWVLFRRGELKLAKFYIERALAQDENNAEIFLHYGDILVALGEKEKAVSFWQKAYDLGEKSDDLLFKIQQNK